MLLDKALPKAKEYFPDLEVKYKNESLFMKIIGLLLFFNKRFMTHFTTTIGSTIYFPSKKQVEKRQYLALMTLLHELVHVWDSKQNKFFQFLYLFPQIMVLLLIPLFWILSWKIVVPLLILFALPLPAYFRMKYERRAYFISLYVLHKISQKHKGYNYLDAYKDRCIKNFKSADYYFMWTLPSINKDFNNMVDKIKNNEKPLNGKIMNIIDDLIEKCFHKMKRR